MDYDDAEEFADDAMDYFAAQGSADPYEEAIDYWDANA